MFNDAITLPMTIVMLETYEIKHGKSLGLNPVVAITIVHNVSTIVCDRITYNQNLWLFPESSLIVFCRALNEQCLWGHLSRELPLTENVVGLQETGYSYIFLAIYFQAVSMSANIFNWLGCFFESYSG